VVQIQDQKEVRQKDLLMVQVVLLVLIVQEFQVDLIKVDRIQDRKEVLQRDLLMEQVVLLVLIVQEFQVVLIKADRIQDRKEVLQRDLLMEQVVLLVLIVQEFQVDLIKVDRIQDRKEVHQRDLLMVQIDLNLLVLHEFLLIQDRVVLLTMIVREHLAFQESRHRIVLQEIDFQKIHLVANLVQDLLSVAQIMIARDLLALIVILIEEMKELVLEEMKMLLVLVDLTKDLLEMNVLVDSRIKMKMMAK